MVTKIVLKGVSYLNASSGLVALISSITDLLVILAVHSIRSSLDLTRFNKMPSKEHLRWQ